MRQGRLIAGMLLSMSVGVGASGCFSGGVWQVPPQESLVTDLTAETLPRVARSQQADAPNPSFRPPAAGPVATPPPLPPTPGGTKQVSLIPTKNVRVNVRAWINGKPIFDEEVMQAIAPNLLREVSSMPEPQRSERLAEVYNQTLENLIDQEVAYQDAVGKLQKGNKKALEKLRKLADDQFQEQMKKIRDSNRATEEQIRDVEHTLRRQMERNFISTEYIRSRIFPIMNSAIGPKEIEEYYKTHLNEFQRLDTLKWQDVFIAVGPKYPTVADARRFAEQLIGQVRTEADFSKLLAYDDGDSKFRNGEGLGTRKGEIKPPEVEEILFRLKDGQIGPVIEISTGVHIVRVVSREYAGQIPLDVKTQNLIRNKLRNQVAEREHKQILRVLKGRSTIEIVKDKTDE